MIFVYNLEVSWFHIFFVKLGGFSSLSATRQLTKFRKRMVKNEVSF